MSPEELDQLLHAALANGVPEPTPGLAARIGAAAGKTAAHRTGWWNAGWPLAAAVVLALAVALAFWPATPSRTPNGQMQATALPARKPHAALPSAQIGVRAAHHAGVMTPGRRYARHALARNSRVPRTWPAVFPSPAPPSPEGRALIAFLRSAPPKLVAAALTFPPQAGKTEKNGAKNDSFQSTLFGTIQPVERAGR